MMLWRCRRDRERECGRLLVMTAICRRRSLRCPLTCSWKMRSISAAETCWCYRRMAREYRGDSRHGGLVARATVGGGPELCGEAYGAPDKNSGATDSPSSERQYSGAGRGNAVKHERHRLS